MKRRIPLILVLLLCLWSSFAAAQIYEWIDKNGVRHFTNLPPPPGAKIVNEQAAIPYDEAADEKRMQEDQELQNQVLEQQQESQTEKQAASRQETPEVRTGSSGSDNTGQSVQYEQRTQEREPIVTPLPSSTSLPERIP